MEKLKNTDTIEEREIYYGEAFDSVAGTYDDAFDTNPVTKQLRRIIYGYLTPHLDKGSSILDINCGTGTDAFYFASHGHRVTCMDVSPQMISLARRKVKEFSGVDLQTGSFEKTDLIPAGQYDLILSNFGGLNCTPDLHPVIDRCYELLKPSGHLAITVMPPVSPWEIVSGVSRLNFKHAFRRMRKYPLVRMNNSSVPVYYHSLRSIRNASKHLFTIKTIRGLNVLSPPPYSRNFANKYPNLSAGLYKLDSFWGILPILRATGDHIIIVMEKRHNNTAKPVASAISKRRDGQ